VVTLEQAHVGVDLRQQIATLAAHLRLADQALLELLAEAVGTLSKARALARHLARGLTAGARKRSRHRTRTLIRCLPGGVGRRLTVNWLAGDRR
jgi:hypothetical protein